MSAGVARLPDVAESGPLIFLIAGEPSGDQLGACLMSALKTETGGCVRFVGIGGERMAAEGLDSLFPMGELSIVGLAEVLPKVPRILRRINQVAQAVRATGADAVITIDSPSFSLRVMKRLAGIEVPRIHYVAPQVWAWKPWRARAMAAYVDRLLVLLPFEPPFFERHGLETSFVGHPVVEVLGHSFDGSGFRGRHGIAEDAPLLCLLPGSRESEVRRLLPTFGEAAAMVAQSVPCLQVVVPTLSSLRERVAHAVAAWPLPVAVVTATEDKHGAFAASQAAIAASGTVAVELAVAGVPCIVAYKVDAFSAFLARRLIRVPYASLINLVAEREIQPEFLQENCTSERLAVAIEPLLEDRAARDASIEAGLEVARALGAGGTPPSRRAAREVLAAVGQPKRSAHDRRNKS